MCVWGGGEGGGYLDDCALSIQAMSVVCECEQFTHVEMGDVLHFVCDCVCEGKSVCVCVCDCISCAVVTHRTVASSTTISQDAPGHTMVCTRCVMCAYVCVCKCITDYKIRNFFFFFFSSLPDHAPPS